VESVQPTKSPLDEGNGPDLDFAVEPHVDAGGVDPKGRSELTILSRGRVVLDEMSG